MKNRILSCILFAALIVCIPLAALMISPVTPAVPLPVNPIPAQSQKGQTESHTNASLQIEAPPDHSATQDTPLSDLRSSAPSNTIASPASFQIFNTATKKVFEVSARDFVRGSLAAEMPPTFHPEALKAQAIAAHSYAAWLTQQREASPVSSLKGATLTADPENWKSYTTEKIFRERYGALADEYWNDICTAADAVSGYLLLYENEPAAAAYHSMSSGITEDASHVWQAGIPYLVAVESQGDPLAPDYETSVSMDTKQMKQILKAALPNVSLSSDPAAWLNVLERSEGGYCLRVQAGDSELPGTELRTLLGLRSANFDISYDGTNFVFTVRGYGHGVGLSQYGADYYARQGMSFEEILDHYYSGTTLAAVIPE